MDTDPDFTPDADALAEPPAPAWEHDEDDGVFPPTAAAEHDNTTVPAEPAVDGEPVEPQVEESTDETGEPVVTWSPENGTPDGLPGVAEAVRAEEDLVSQETVETRPPLKGVAEDLAAAWPPDSAPGWGDDTTTPQEG